MLMCACRNIYGLLDLWKLTQNFFGHEDDSDVTLLPDPQFYMGYYTRGW